jgi:hypothetical protein
MTGLIITKGKGAGHSSVRGIHCLESHSRYERIGRQLLTDLTKNLKWINVPALYSGSNGFAFWSRDLIIRDTYAFQCIIVIIIPHYEFDLKGYISHEVYFLMKLETAVWFTFAFSQTGRSYTRYLVDSPNRQTAWTKHLITRAHVQLRYKSHFHVWLFVKFVCLLEPRGKVETIISTTFELLLVLQ